MQEIYFAAANSGEGFRSFYHEIFNPLRFTRMYLIKGGPGTGKSTLMRRVAERAERDGMTVRRYACSSDPESLDGIAVGDGDFAMLDATAPHTQDPRFPGAAEALIDLGQFWDSRTLAAARDEIVYRNTTKQAAYVRAYRFLAAICAVEQNTLAMLEECLDLPKLRGAVSRALQSLPRAEGRIVPALVSSIGMHGEVNLPTLHHAARRSFVLTETRGGADLFLREVLALARQKHLDAEAAYRYIDPTRLDGLYLPGGKVAFLDEVLIDERRPQDKQINMSRFYRPADLRRYRTELRKAAHCRADLFDGAAEAFAAVREAHFALEAIYSAAMDYAALDAFCAPLIDHIFAELSH
ncbi:MAG: hypothetical protein IJF49_05200 [Clostridia bacterium]|nr:hypothetical protein [Clostridia bacterium]